MKLLKTFVAGAIALASAGAFAQSSQSGVDPTGEGVIHINGTAVGSCTAPTFTVNLGNIDFHTAKNGATGVYEHTVNLPVVCTNPAQHWRIEPQATVEFELASGVLGGEPEKGYVSLTNINGVPGAEWEDELDEDEGTPLAGVGTSSAIGKLIFGKNPSTYDDGQGGLVFDDEVSPTGTIDGRGDFTADIVLKIIY